MKVLKNIWLSGNADSAQSENQKCSALKIFSFEQSQQRFIFYIRKRFVCSSYLSSDFYTIREYLDHIFKLVLPERPESYYFSVQTEILT